jgi:Uma2 family endonuclease
MVSPTVDSPRLLNGMRLSASEFLARWEALPDLKDAELIEGIVYVSSPVGFTHGRFDASVSGLLSQYADETPGCEAANNATCNMLGNLPQPDSVLRIREEFGGSSRMGKVFLEGAPELAVEICTSSADLDFGPKLALYQRAGVREYITFETHPKRIVWRMLVGGSYKQIRPDAAGILRSHRFPGLWLDTAAFWAGDGKRKRDTLRAGIESDEHRAFVEQLAKLRT